MNKQQLKALLAVNLRLLNPQITDRYRKKEITGTKLTKRLSWQFLYNAAIFVLIYGLAMYTIDFSKYPGMFTFYLALFILLGVSQSISGIFNIFFVAKDLPNYLALPFHEKEIFTSKIIIVSLNIIPFTLPSAMLFLATSFRFKITPILGIVISVILFLLINVILEFLCSIIVFGLSKTDLFRKHQSMIMNSLMTITIVIAVAGILVLNQKSQNATTSGLTDYPSLTPLLPFYQLFKNPLSGSSILMWIVLVLAVGVLFVVVKRLILNNLSEQLTTINSDQMGRSNQKKFHKKHSLRSILLSYNWQLLKEPNLILQMITYSLMIPLIIIISVALGDFSKNLSIEWFGVFFVGGLLLSFLVTNQASLVANLISLDRTNFEFIKALPISVKSYLREKFYFGMVFQVIMNLIMVIVMTLLWKVPLILASSMFLGSIWGTYFVSAHYFKRDYRLRSTNWTNVTELFNRGAGNLAMVLTMFLVLLLGGAILGVYIFAIVFYKHVLLINSGVLLAIIIASGISLTYYERKFWNIFD